MPTTIQIAPLGTYPAGTYELPPTAVPVGTLSAEMTIDVTTQPDPLPSFDLAFEQSFDGGVVWGPGGSASRATGPKGAGRTTLGFTATMADPSNADRMVRGSLVLGGSCALSATARLLP